MVNVFFFVNGEFLVHECENDKSDKYGNFLNYPDSHMEVWDKNYQKKYRVDFDYYPRGRVIYNIKEDVYYIYHDKCIKDMNTIIEKYKNDNYKICEDFHYQCHNCNNDYVL